ncbi:MAG: FAD synthetase [Rikenellaceae bacterium]
MLIFSGIESIGNLDCTTVSVGSFDGVHSGHSSLLRTLNARAKECGNKSLVVSFTPHPRVTLGRTEGLKLLTSDEEKAELLKDQGIDALLYINFNKAFSKLSYEEFVIDYLIKGANMKELVVGFNHHIGHDSGNYNKLEQVAKKYGFTITLAEEFSGTGEKISSTTIRSLLETGNIELANRLLGHPYLMIGQSDSRGAVEFEEPLKLIPPAGQYITEINGVTQIITIDHQQRLWCNTKNSKVKIKIVGRYEK